MSDSKCQKSPFTQQIDCLLKERKGNNCALIIEDDVDFGKFQSLQTYALSKKEIEEAGSGSWAGFKFGKHAC